MNRIFFLAVLFAMTWALITLTSCKFLPPVTVEGNFADYSYSPKSGLVLRPRTTIIRIRSEK